jgi:phosphoenolpyruvate carboxylase
MIRACGLGRSAAAAAAAAAGPLHLSRRLSQRLSLSLSSCAAPPPPPAHDIDSPLKADVKWLGGTLGNVISQQAGASVYEEVEVIRTQARAWRENGDEAAFMKLKDRIQALNASDIKATAKAFTHFLALANAAESHHRLRRLRQWATEEEAGALPSRADTSLGVIKHLIGAGGSESVATKGDIYRALSSQTVELVLTAHPTEVNRRTLLHKHKSVSHALEMIDQLPNITAFERKELETSVRRSIETIWGSDEVRRVKPSPQDEARAGMAIIEQVLWDAVPAWLRKLDNDAQAYLGKPIAVDASPVKFASWMGGDRDGNPNVTPKVTLEVSFTARWQAAALLLRDVKDLRMDLSITHCSPSLRAVAGDVREPYREVLKGLEHKLEKTLLEIKAMLSGQKPFSVQDLPVSSKKEVLGTLRLLHDSLSGTGQDTLASGLLKDVIRRVSCFGMVLAPLDIRQESTRHSETLDAITRWLGAGSYLQWDEDTRQSWLLAELNSKRPLLPHLGSDAAPSFDPVVKDVLDTFRAIADLGEEALGAYVISMAHVPSDVLAVKLLMKEFCVGWNMRVVPLFETLDDLKGSSDTMRTLWTLPWYKGAIEGEQEVMIGYSDSAKDAGRLAAAWSQYEAQEQLAQLAKAHNVKLTFFHGKGGTVSRGGNPALFQAILAQPPGTVEGTFRVTEQGEMITQNFGHQGIAERTLDIYTAGVLWDKFVQPDMPKDDWRRVMNNLSETSCRAYRSVVREDPRFVPYFRSATPELELASLNIGSRPAKRRPTGGVETLRAIPWVFAWTQNRLNLPAWLGVGEALSTAAESDKAVLDEMYKEFPFFNTNIDLFEMVLAKTEARISEQYDAQLVKDSEGRSLGDELRKRLALTKKAVLNISGNDQLIQKNQTLQWQLLLRNPYIDPLNLMQATCLARLRESKCSPEEKQVLEDALVICINGVAAGCRNTG